MKNVFVVDDDPGTRLAIEYILKKDGYTIESFENTSKFLHKMQVSQPDLILLDIRLPDGDGIQLCKIVKRNAATTHIPVIIMSSHLEIRTITQEACADDFIQKPFELEDLKYKVSRAF